MSPLIGLILHADRKVRFRFAGIIFLSVITALTELLFAVSILDLISGLSHRMSGAAFFGACSTTQLVCIILGLAILRSLLGLLLASLHARTIYDCEISSWLELLENYLGGQYSQMKVKSLATMTRLVTYDTNETYEIYLHSWLVIMTEASVVAFLTCYLLYLNPGATLGTLACGTLIFVIMGRLLGQKSQKLGDQYYEVSHLNQKRIMETLEGHLQIRTMQVVQSFLSRVRESSKRFGDLSTRIRRINECPKAILDLALAAMIGVAVVWLGQDSDDTEHRLSFLTASLIAGIRLFPSLGKMATAFNNVSYYKRTCQRFLQDFSEIRDANVSVRAESPNTPIEFRNFQLDSISYSYPNSDKFIFRDFSLEFQLGDWLNLQGRSGTGKSTLLEIILNLLPITKGQLRINGRSPSDVELKAWAQQIAYLPQTPLLLESSIRENILFGMKTALEDSELLELLQHVGLYERLSERSEGLEWNIGPRGSRLSGGERQRLVIARALASKRPILLFDESTSALDLESEKLIFDSIRTLRPNLTMIWVTHDPRYRFDGMKTINLNSTIQEDRTS